jgi:hypothetical protein
VIVKSGQPTASYYGWKAVSGLPRSTPHVWGSIERALHREDPGGWTLVRHSHGSRSHLAGKRPKLDYARTFGEKRHSIQLFLYIVHFRRHAKLIVIDAALREAFTIRHPASGRKVDGSWEVHFCGGIVILPLEQSFGRDKKGQEGTD